MTALHKGMLLGVSNAIVIAFAMAGCVAMGKPAVETYSFLGGGLWNAHGGPPPAGVVLQALLLWGIGAGIGLGALIGSMKADGMPSWLRAGGYVLCANSSMLVLGALWPELLPGAFIPTTIHALVLARWTEDEPRVPAMRIVESRS